MSGSRPATSLPSAVVTVSDWPIGIGVAELGACHSCVIDPGTEVGGVGRACGGSASARLVCRLSLVAATIAATTATTTTIAPAISRSRPRFHGERRAFPGCATESGAAGWRGRRFSEP